MSSLKIDRVQLYETLNKRLGTTINGGPILSALVDALCTAIETEHARWFEELFKSSGDWDQIVDAREP